MSKAVVTHVIDGDTFDIKYSNGRTAKIRLTGVNTPESLYSPHKHPEPFGEEAHQYTLSRLEGKKVELVFDKQKKDMYGRTLAYVYIDGEFFNLTLVAEGYARVYTWLPNTKHEQEFITAETQAIQENKVLWATGYFKPDHKHHR